MKKLTEAKVRELSNRYLNMEISFSRMVELLNEEVRLITLQRNARIPSDLFALYPNSEALGLSDENKPVAWFKHNQHAEEFGKSKYGRYYVVKTWN
jgi:hypothetical protein